MTEGVVSSWHKVVGDRIEMGSTLLTVESDKSEMDVESFQEGYIAKILVNEGDTATVGSVLAYVVASKDHIPLLDTATSAVRDNSIPVPSTAPTQAGGSLLLQRVAHHTEPAAAAAQARPTAPPWVARRSAEGLQATFMSRIQDSATASQQLQRLEQSGPDGAKLLASIKERIAYHPPPASLLLGTGIPLGPAGTQQYSAPVGASQRGVEATLGARVVATNSNLDVSKVKGSGNYGRVTLRDVENALGVKSMNVPVTLVANGGGTTAQHSNANRSIGPLEAGQNTSATMYSDVPLTSSQKAIAKNMMNSLNVPVFRLTNKIRIDKLLELYKDLKTHGVTWSTVLAKTLAAVLSRPQHITINSYYDDATSTIKQPDGVSIAIAVATAEGGLLTPVLRDVGRRSILDICGDWTRLVQKARDKQIKPQDCAGGTFYVSNLGTYGVSQFDAILPQKAGCIMSIGAIKQIISSPTDTTSAKLNLVNEMKVTITCDHRHINGAAAALFMKDYTEAVQSPASLLIS
eukprot:Lankesteria_metandrocarpae@DN3385_c1_g1_i1.p1